MTVIKRNLLIFKPKGFVSGISAKLLADKWNLHVAHNMEDVSKLLRKHEINVGLCLIQQCNDQQFLTQVNRLFYSTSQVFWVMGLPTECTPEFSPSSIESKLIAEYCENYVTCPIDMEQLLFSLGYAFGMAELNKPGQNDTDGYPSCYGIIGGSPAMQDLFKKLRKVAREDCSILIEGETGTGKELIANGIHNHSSRSGQALVAINCGAFPKDLIQAELFGYEKGAFTGAIQQKIGRIESAQGGTLFLDEIGDLPLEQQINLLRFLEERAITRVGGSVKIPVDVRIIAATHVNLKAAVEKGVFREDLFYRLKVLQLRSPPLRERDNDIELMAWYYFKKFSALQSYKAKGFSAESLAVLRSYDWPGNVRELMNSIRHAIVMSDNRYLSPADLGLDKRKNKDRVLKTLEEARADADKESIINCLYHAKSNMSLAAKMLGITRVSLYRLISKYEIEI